MPEITQATLRPQDEFCRLLVCYNCSTVEKIPPYDGPRDDHGAPARREDGSLLHEDWALEYALKPHRSDGEPHNGNLMVLDEATWEAVERRGTDMLTQETGLDSVGEIRDTIKDDALKCFSDHNRPEQGCIDWCDHSKWLGNGGDAPVGTNPYTGQREDRRIYLCHACPVTHGHVLTDLRHRAGLYKEN